MAILGKRSLQRTGEDRQIFWCICGTPDHQMTLWIPDDDFLHEHGQTEIWFQHQASFFRERVTGAWKTLRGQPASRAWVILNYGDLLALRDGVNGIIERIETLTELEETTESR